MKIAIQGHPTKGHEVIQILESLGGINQMNYEGGNSEKYYYIARDSIITVATAVSSTYTKYTLKEFKKEFPFKVGDIVFHKGHKAIVEMFVLRKNCYYIRYNNPPINGIYYTKWTTAIELKMKEERNITLTLEKAKEWYKKGGELREVALQAFSEEELNKVELPKTWEEFCENYMINNSEAYFDTCCNIYSADATCRHSLYDKNICQSKKSAKAHLAMIQLEQLRNCWWNGWEPIWDCSEKWCIRLWGNELGVGVAAHISRFLTFPTNEMAREFLECFRDLIEKARDLI